jgi:hypothetical protein
VGPSRQRKGKRTKAGAASVEKGKKKRRRRSAGPARGEEGKKEGPAQEGEEAGLR